MPVEFKDDYQVLGVNRNATARESKKTFRKLVRKFHLDVAKDKIKAEGRFKGCYEAIRRYRAIG